MKEITLEAVPANIIAVTDFINEYLEALDCPMKAQMQIDVALDELFSNISYYAYAPGTGKVTVRIESAEDTREVVISFIDGGKPYNPLLANEPDISLSAEERKTGGLGIFLVKKTMDDMQYEYSEGRNILRIKKII